MTELDEIRKKKLEELMQMQQAQAQQQVELMENIVKQLFTKEALVRYGNLKAAHQEKALQLLLILFQAIQQDQIKRKIDDSTLKKLLGQLTQKRKEIKIRRV